jgi:hypothetical protein
VHIRIQQRNGRKSVTTCSGLPADLDYKKIVKVLKKSFSTNGVSGAIVHDDENYCLLSLALSLSLVRRVISCHCRASPFFLLRRRCETYLRRVAAPPSLI